MSNRAISRNRTSIKLIAVGPLERKTERYIRFLNRHPKLIVEEVRNNKLPDISTHSAENVQKEFAAHLDFYVAQLRLAKASHQFPILVSGCAHHFSAPFLVALQDIHGIKPEVIAFDAHSDCYSTRLDPGGFWPWLIKQGYLEGGKLHLVGTDIRVPNLNFEKFYSVEMKEMIAERLSDVWENAQENFSFLNDLAAKIVKDEVLDLEKYLQMILPSERHHFSLHVPLFPFGVAGSVISLECIHNVLERDISQYFHGYVENRIISENKIGLICTPEELEKDIATGEKVFVSLDTDVSYNQGFSIAELGIFFETLSTIQVIALHVEEFDSPRTSFSPEEVGNMIVERLLCQGGGL